MATFDGIQLAPAADQSSGGPWGGSASLPVWLATPDGRRDVSGDAFQGLVQTLVSTIAGTRLDATGGPYQGLLAVIAAADASFRLDATGQAWFGRFIPISAVYRNADRVTLAGLAVNLAGQPLRSVQIQFIGETVQDHFFGAGTDTAGVYVAYLETGDTYTAYAFSPTTGIVFKLDHQETGPNTTTLVFRQVTKRGGFGEGLFLQGVT